MNTSSTDRKQILNNNFFKPLLFSNLTKHKFVKIKPPKEFLESPFYEILSAFHFRETAFGCEGMVRWGLEVAIWNGE